MKIELTHEGWVNQYYKDSCDTQDKEIALKVAELYLKMDQIENAEKIIEKVLKGNNYTPYDDLRKGGIY